MGEFLPGLRRAGRGERAVQVGFGGVGSWPSTSSVAGLMTSWVRLPSPARNSPSIYSANCSYMPVVPAKWVGREMCPCQSKPACTTRGGTSFARRTGAIRAFQPLRRHGRVDTMRAPLAVRTRYPPCNPSTRIRPASTPGFFRFIDWLRHRIALSSLVGDHPIFDNSRFRGSRPWRRRPPSAPSCWNSFQSAIIFRLFTRFPRCRHDHVGQSVEDLRLHGLRPAVGPQPAALSGHRSGAGRHSRPAHRLFSILEPGKRIPLHTGPYNGVLRLHLGLVVPDPAEQCGGSRSAASVTAGARARQWCSTICIPTRSITTPMACAPSCSWISSGRAGADGWRRLPTRSAGARSTTMPGNGATTARSRGAAECPGAGPQSRVRGLARGGRRRRG